MEKSLQKQTSVFDRGQVLGLHCAGKSTKETSEMTAIGVRTVQKTIAQWKKDRKKIRKTRDRRSLKRLVKSNWRKSVQQLTIMFNEGH